MNRSVVIDCFPASAQRYVNRYAIVVVDVIRATTTATTALAQGRRVFPVQTTDEAFVLASKLSEPLLVGELGGYMPFNFDLTNSPLQIANRNDFYRPMIFISSSGTQLLMNATRGRGAVYISCLRNLSALAGHLIKNHNDVAILGAGTRGQFRREDQIGCAWLAEKLLEDGYLAGTPDTLKYVNRWSGADLNLIREGRSAKYLLKSNQKHDLDFVIENIDDLEVVPRMIDGEIVAADTSFQTPSMGEDIFQVLI